MKLLQVQFKNVFSYSDELQQFDFGAGKFNQLVGKNGVGKSSFKDCIIFGLYGKLDGVNTSDIPNDTNPKGYISVKYTIGADQYVNEWFFTPNKLNIYKNGELLDLGGLSITKSYLINNIIDIPYKIFSNIICINVGDFKSFLTMSKSDIRDIRDRIFGLDDINSMLSACKDDLIVLEKECAGVSGQLQSSDSNIASLRESYQSGMEEHELKMATDKAQLENDIVAKRQEWTGAKALYDNHKLSILQKQSELEIAKNFKNKLYSRAATRKMGDLTNSISIWEEQITIKKSVLSRIHMTVKHMDSVEIAKKSISIKNKLDSIKHDSTKLSASVVKLDADINDSSSSLESYKSLSLVHHANLLWASTIEKKEVLSNKETEMSQLISTGNDLVMKKSECDTLIANNKAAKIQYESHLSAHLAGKCHTCGSELSTDDVDTIKRKIDDVDGVIRAAALSSSELSDSISQNNEYKTKLQTTITLLTREISLVDTIDSFTPLDDDFDYDITVSKIHELTDRLSSLNSEKSKLMESLNHNNTELVSLSSTLSALPQHHIPDDFVPMVGDKNELLFNADKLNSEISTIQAQIDDSNTSMLALRDKLSVIKSKIDINLPQYDGQKNFKAVDSHINSMEMEITNDNSTTATMEELLSNLSYQGKDLKSKLQQIQRGYDKYKTTMEDMISKAVSSRDALFEESKIKLNRVDILKASAYVLGDKGVKSYILRSIIPFMNDEVNKILQRFDVKFGIVFDADFMPCVFRNGKQVNVKSISTGQTKMANFAILLSMSKILKIRYNSLGVLFYDELFSTIDTDRINVILEIIKEVCCDELGINMVIMNHSVLPEVHFDAKIEITSDNGFSKLNTINL